MVSFIIVSREKKKREAYSKDFATKHNISSFDITIIDKDSSVKTTSANIGIDSVKLLQSKLYFKPIKSDYKLVVLEDAQFLTPEAQNALLKVLEEPPAHTYIMLNTETKEVLLPTILSRCQIIELKEDKTALSQKTLDELSAFINSLSELSLEERLKKAETLGKEKDKAIMWVESLILVAREKLLQTETLTSNRETLNEQLAMIKFLQSLHTLLKTTNVNPRFAIEHTLLNL